MIGEQVECARKDCGNVLTKTTHNQKYCGPECCKIATNAEIMRKYHKRNAIRKGEKRKCGSCGITSLSRYNPTDVCSSCEEKQRRATSDGMTALTGSVVWL